MPSSRVQILLAAGILAAGCAGESGERVASDILPVDTVHMQLAWEVTEGIHPTADSLGDLSGIAVDRTGNVYVSDRAAIKIWVFDSTGRSLDAIGRKGEGPGEFESPTGIAIGPDDRLYVRDVYFVSIFGAEPTTGRLSRYIDNFRGPLYGDWRSTRASRFSTTNRMYYPAYTFSDRTARTAVYHIYEFPDGLVTDSLDVPGFTGAPAGWASYPISAGSGRILRGLNHVPFAPLPVWDVTPRGTLISGDGRTYVLRETDRAGALLREYRRDVAPLRIPEQLRSDSLAALDARLDSVPVPFSQVNGMPPEVVDRQLPETFPAYVAVYATPEGQIWVRRWTAEQGERSVFDVFEGDGTFSHVVVLPRDIAAFPTPVLSRDGVAAVGIDPETGAHMVLRFKAP